MLKQIRQDLSLFMEESQKSQKQVAKEMGVSTSIISQFLSGIYQGDNEGFAKSAEQYLKIAGQRLKNSHTNSFYECLRNTNTSYALSLPKQLLKPDE
jgi:DNA transposition AAA+ family ATPase